MNVRVWNWVLAVALTSAPLPAAAQCMGGMTSGDHQHGQPQAKKTEERAKKADEKAKRSAAKLLADPDGRDALLTAVLGDTEFLRALLVRMAAVPEWRALMRERAVAPPEAGPALEGRSESTGRPEQTAPEAPGEPRPGQAAAFRCPMHPDVVSDRPGTCPRCGMELEAVR